MSRPRTRRAPGARGVLGHLLLTTVLVLLLAGLAAPATASGTPEPPGPREPPTAEAPADPLAVSILSLSPSTLPTSGRLEVTGNVTNWSEGTWTDLSVYLVVSPTPLTTETELAAAVASDPRTDVGDRIVAPGLYVDIADLAPRQTAGYRLSVPSSALGTSGRPGVYWLAVHVLGTSEEGRLEGADGRARTFLPLVPESNAGTELALGIQARGPVERSGSGLLVDEERWARSLSDRGRLGRTAALAGQAGGWPLTWVVDPAVLDAAVSMSRGNPQLALASTAVEPADGGAEGSATDPPEEDGEEGPGDGGDERSAAARDAEQWLDAMTTRMRASPTLAVPYADVDLTGATRAGSSELVAAAFATGSALLDDLGVSATPAVAPFDGRIGAAALERLEPAVVTVLAPAAVDARIGAGDPPLLARPAGGRVLLAPTAETVVGPGPNAPRSALAVRQRLLADAALHALSAGRAAPLARLLPATWDPGPGWARADFFQGLDVPWLRGASLRGLVGAVPAGELDEEAVTGPDVEVAAAAFADAEALVAAGADLGELLAVNDVFADQVTRLALTTVSQWIRLRPWAAARRAELGLENVDRWLSQVSIRTPSFVTMSSEEGTFQVTVVNDLEQAVTVGLRVTVVGGDLELSAPEPVQVAAEGRTAMRIDAVAEDIGVHQVVLQPVSAAGTPVGEPTTLNIRASRVGFILWVVMAGGAAALVVAVTLRIWRRVRRRRRTHGPLLQQRPTTRGAR